MPGQFVRYKPTQKQRGIVEAATAFGVIQSEIASQLDIDLKTLRKYYRRELDGGKFKLDMAAGNTLVKLLNSKDERVRLESAKWYTARRMGWKETSITENVGKDGGPIETRDVSALDEFKARVASATERLDGPSDDSDHLIELSPVTPASEAG